MLNTDVSPEVQALADALSAVSPGSTISYATLSEAIGRPIQPRRWLVLRALGIVAEDHGAVFATERGVGYTRLETEKLHTVGHTARTAIRRKARKAAKMIRHGSLRANDVSPEAVRKMNAELSALGLIEHAAKDAVAAPVPAHDARPEPVALIARRFVDAMTG